MGTLKLKGDAPKKKIKSSTTKESRDPAHLQVESSKSAAGRLKQEDPVSPSASLDLIDDSPVDNRTDAEKKFDQEQRKRLAAKVAKDAKKSHKDRVAEFNAKLEAQSEHHDIPKVGPG